MSEVTFDYYYIKCPKHGYLSTNYATKDEARWGVINHTLQCDYSSTILKSTNIYYDETGE